MCIKWFKKKSNIANDDKKMVDEIIKGLFAG